MNGAAGFTASLMIAFLWGVLPVIHKTVLATVSHHTVLVMSSVFYMVCTVAYAIIYRRQIAEGIRSIQTSHVFYIAVGAIVCGFLANVLYYNVLKDPKNDSHIVSALIYASPVFTLILAYLLLHERIRFMGFLGVVTITIGVVFLAFNGSGGDI
jgi:uncharacterized membrane protein